MSKRLEMLEEQNHIMREALIRINNQPHYGTIDGIMNGWAKNALAEYYKIKREYARCEDE